MSKMVGKEHGGRALLLGALALICTLLVVGQASAANIFQVSPNGGNGADVIVGPDGTGHFVWNQRSTASGHTIDNTKYCQVLEGDSNCSAVQSLFTRIDSSGDAISDQGPRIDYQGTDLRVATFRVGNYPSPSTSGGITDVNTSTDSGNSFGVAEQFGTGPIDGSFLADFGSRNISIGGIAAATVQVSPESFGPIVPATAQANIGDSTTGTTSLGVSTVGSNIYVSAAMPSGSGSRVRSYLFNSASLGLTANVASNWGPPVTVPGGTNAKFGGIDSSGRALLIYRRISDSRYVSAGFDPQTGTFSAEKVLSPANVAGAFYGVGVANNGAKTHVAWRIIGGGIGYNVYDAATDSWGEPQVITNDSTDGVFAVRVSANDTGRGFAVLFDGSSPSAPVRAVPLLPVGTTGGGPGPGPGPGTGPGTGPGPGRPSGRDPLGGTDTPLTRTNTNTTGTTIGGTNVDFLTPTKGCVKSGFIRVALKIKAKRNQVKGKVGKRQKLYVKRVWFYVDKKVQVKDKKAPYKARIDVRLKPGSKHTLRSRIFYTLGKSKKQKSKNITRKFQICP